jgi:hypothetical protein
MKRIGNFLTVTALAVPLHYCTLASVYYKKRSDLPDADICAQGNRSAPVNYNVFSSNQDAIRLDLKVSWERHAIWIFASVIPLFGLWRETLSNFSEVRITNNRVTSIYFAPCDVRYFSEQDSAPLPTPLCVNNEASLIKPGETTEVQLEAADAVIPDSNFLRLEFTEAETGKKLTQTIRIEESSATCIWAMNR